MKSETIAALRGTISTLLKNRADFSLKTYETPPEILLPKKKEQSENDQERTNPHKKSGPPYRIRDVTSL